jgi:stage V sporulation protein G
MKITEVKVFPVEEEKLKAFVSVVFDECFMVNDIKIIRGKEGLFISMPSRRKKNGKFKDVAHPLNNETRQMIEGLVLAEYNRMVGGEEGEAVPRPLRTPDAERPVAAEEPATAIAAATAAEPAAEESGEPAEERSLEEVAELHLRDSFWTT